MKHAFSPDGEAALRSRVSADTLIALDYDGTLSPIVLQPQRARTAPAIGRPLRMLNDIARVAIITGRSIDDIRRRLAISPSYLIGNHGLEGLPGDRGPERRTHGVTQQWLQQLEYPLSMEAALPGTVVENKVLSLSIHYRLARDRTQAQEAIMQRVSNLEPAPRIIGGKHVINLLPSEAPDKGDALLRLVAISGCRNALFVGDDDTDETVFRAAASDWITVRVGYSAESAAHYFVQHQAEVGPLLYRLLAAMQIAGRKGPHQAAGRTTQ